MPFVIGPSGPNPVYVPPPGVTAPAWFWQIWQDAFITVNANQDPGVAGAVFNVGASGPQISVGPVAVGPGLSGPSGGAI